MKLSSEIETLLLCAQYHRRSSELLTGIHRQSDDVHQRAAALESLLRESEGLLLARLGEVAVRAGLIRMDHVTDDIDLGALADLVFNKNATPPHKRHGAGVVVLNPVNHDADLMRGALLGDPQALIRRGVRELLYSITEKESSTLETMYGILRDGATAAPASGRVLSLAQTAAALGWTRAVTDKYLQSALRKIRCEGRASSVSHLLAYIDRAALRSQDEVFLTAVYT